MIKERKQMTPEAINIIIHKFMGNCIHDWKKTEYETYFVIQCKLCDANVEMPYPLMVGQGFPDYFNSLDLLRPAEMKLDNEKFVQYVGLVINSQYGEVRFDDVCSALTAPASHRATALAEVIGGITNGE